jgi:hypothetical protein
MLNKKYILESEKLIIENFHSVLSKIDSNYTLNERLSPELRDAAYSAASDKYNTTSTDARLDKKKYAQQMDTFSKTVNPELAMNIKKIAKNFGFFVSIEKFRNRPDSEPYIVLYFSNNHENPDDYKFMFKVSITKDKYKITDNDSEKQIVKDYFDRPLLNLIKKIQNTEFIK